jgi:hypothetical protein
MAQVVRLTTEQLAERLATLERELGMPAQEFYDRFRAGQQGDSPDVVEWAALCYMATRAGMLKPQPSHA